MMRATHQKQQSPGGAGLAANNQITERAQIIGDDQGADKALTTLKAQLALAGHQVHEGSNNDFIVVKADWGMSRYLADVGALRRFARQLGVAHE